MRFDVVTLFPELFAPFMTQGIARRAFVSGAVDVKLHQLRDFADAGDHYRRVDDRPYGGGPGMVMLAAPLMRCVDQIRRDRIALSQAASSQHVPVVFFTPTGKLLTHRVVQEFAHGHGAILVCGRYEGVDQRFIEQYVDIELSLGDFVLSGGEIASMALLDAVARLQPGVLGDELSSEQDSFNTAFDGLLDYPHYTRPETLAGELSGNTQSKVPAVLLSGDHARIARWRREQQLSLTLQRRPDLIKKALAAGTLSVQDCTFLQKKGYNTKL